MILVRRNPAGGKLKAIGQRLDLEVFIAREIERVGHPTEHIWPFANRHEVPIAGLDVANAAQNDNRIFAVTGVISIGLASVQAHGRHVQIIPAGIFRVHTGEFPGFSVTGCFD